VCGLLRATIGNHSVSLAAGDALFVPRGTKSVLEASGAGPARAHFAAFLPDAPPPSRVRCSEMHEPAWPAVSVS
jgi:quercetin dioxygenase-like cupin family protein